MVEMFLGVLSEIRTSGKLNKQFKTGFYTQ